MIDSPSLVPDLPCDVSALRAALSIIETLIEFDAELRKWFVADESAHIYTQVPGLLDHTRKWVNGMNQSKQQGQRTQGRVRNNDERAVAWARQFRLYQHDANYWNRPLSDIKELVGQRHPPRDPFSEHDIALPPLKRSQAIAMIDRGLALIATGKHPVSR